MSIYRKSFNHKIHLIKIIELKLKSNSFLEYFDNCRSELKPINFFNVDAEEVFILYEILLESIILITNSLFDVILQIITDELINKMNLANCKEYQVNTKIIGKYLGSDHEIYIKCICLHNSPAGKYITSFSNIIKHRTLIKQKHLLSGDGSSLLEIDDFTYSTVNFELTYEKKNSEEI